MWESTVFETLRVLSVLLITVSTRMPVAQSKLSPPCCWYLVPPKHTAAMQGFFKLDLSIYWHSRWTSSSNCSASAMGGTLLHGTWTHVALSATFTAVCVTRSTWKGPSHLLSSSFSCDHESPRNHQVSPRAISQQPSPGQLLPAQKYLTTDKTFFAVIQHVILTPHPLMAAFVYPPLCPWTGGLPNKISNGLRFVFTLFFLILMYISTIGRALSQVRPVSSQHFANSFLIVWFSASLLPHLTMGA